MDGQKLRALRLRNGWSVEQVAGFIGVNPHTVRRWEREEHEPQDVYRVQLEKLYQMSPAMIKPNGIDDIISDIFDMSLSTKIYAYIFVAAAGGIKDIKILQRQIIREIDMNNHFTRRDVLRHIIALPALAMQLDRNITQQLLYLVAGGVTICEDLARGGKDDIDTAFGAVSVYASLLKPVVKDSSTYRQQAACLMAQCLLLKAVLAPHVESLTQAVQYAQDAATYAATGNDASLQATALLEIAQTHYYHNNYFKSLRIGEEALSLLQPQKTHIANRVLGHCYSHIGKFQAANGQKQEALTSLGKAHQHFHAQSLDDPPATYVDFVEVNLILREGLTYSHLGKHKEALDSLSQVDLLSPRQFSEQTRVETKSNQALAALMQPNKDMEQVLSLWEEGIEGIIEIQSEKHFEEACRILRSIECVWPEEPRVMAMKKYTRHW